MYPYFIIETALMIGSGYDTTWRGLVCDPGGGQRKRLKADRGYSDERIDMIFASQSKDEDFLKRYTKVINNDDDIPALERQVERLLGIL